MICVQCHQPADLHIHWLAKKSVTPDENVFQECDICSECLGHLWANFKHGQFGQTLSIQPVG